MKFARAWRQINCGTCDTYQFVFVVGGFGLPSPARDDTPFVIRNSVITRRSVAHNRSLWLINGALDAFCVFRQNRYNKIICLINFNFESFRERYNIFTVSFVRRKSIRIKIGLIFTCLRWIFSICSRSIFAYNPLLRAYTHVRALWYRFD